MGRRIEKIYVHCSDSEWGNENAINHWHKARRFLFRIIGGGYQISTGYHLVVLNGKPFKNEKYIRYLDGAIETARPFSGVGAGVKGDNWESIHVCLIGKPGLFTDAQLETLYRILASHVKNGGLDIATGIKGHYEYWTDRDQAPRKTCPGIDMDKLRSDLARYIVTKNVAQVAPVRQDPRRTSYDVILDAINFLLGGKRGK